MYVPYHSLRANDNQRRGQTNKRTQETAGASRAKRSGYSSVRIRDTTNQQTNKQPLPRTKSNKHDSQRQQQTIAAKRAASLPSVFGWNGESFVLGWFLGKSILGNDTDGFGVHNTRRKGLPPLVVTRGFRFPPKPRPEQDWTQQQQQHRQSPPPSVPPFLSERLATTRERTSPPCV